ncbi:MAG: DNA internalization-related competence protein ComEC/Rec2 [Anaerovoracaceae bacterium]
MRRPVVTAAAGFALGIPLAVQFKFIVIMVPVIWLLVLAVYILRVRGPVIVFLCFLAAGCSLMTLCAHQVDPLTHLDGKNARICGVLTSSSVKNGRARLELREDGGGRVLLSVYQRDGEGTRAFDGLRDGIRIEAYASLSSPSPARNPGCFDYRMYLKTKRISMTASAGIWQVKTCGIASKPRYSLWLLRHDFRERLSPYMDKESLGMLQAMLFGDKSGLEEKLYEDFQKNGTAHILAVSGLHVGMVYGLFCGILGGRRRLSTNFIIIMMLGLYAALAGFSPSVVRAVIMIVMHMISRLAHYRYDLMTAAALTALLMLVYNPYQIFGLGFQLSFLAIFTLAAVMPVFAAMPLPPLFRSVLLPVLAIQAGMAPYTAYVFNYFSLGAFAANIPVIFLAGIVVPAGALALMATALLPPLSGFCAAFLSVGTRCIVGANDLLYAGGATAFDVVSPPLPAVLAYYGLFFFFFSEMARIWIIRRRRRSIASGLLCILMMVLFFNAGWNSGFRSAEVVFVDVGQGSCIHLRTPKGHNILIDGGGREDYNMGRKTLKPYLLKNGVRRIDLALATHKDMDHYKGLVELKKEGMVKQLITNDMEIEPGTVLVKEGDFRITTVAPAADTGDIGSGVTTEENESSLVFRVDSRDWSLLATGDIGKDTEKNIAAYWDQSGGRMLDVDVIAVPHHGSRNSSSAVLLKKSSPSVAVIQVGKNNYGHPAPQTVAAYRKAGASVFRNDEDGALGIFKGFRWRRVINSE